MRKEDRVGDDVAVCAGLRPAFHRVVGANTGEPGTGLVNNVTKIVWSKA